jgi:predicted transposase YdaD
MGSVLDEVRQEGMEENAKRTVINLIKLGKNSLEEIAEVTGLPFDTVKELEKQTLQTDKKSKIHFIKKSTLRKSRRR